jgi:subfamily B ATP-binding cassette protein MsbA
MTAARRSGPGARSDWKTYFRLLRYARPYTGRLVIGISFGAFFGGSTLGMLAALQSGFVRVFGGEDTPLNRVVKEWAAHWGNGDSSVAITAAILLLMPLFAILRGVGFFLSKYFIEWVGNRVVLDIRNQLFSHLQELSMQFINRSRSGELISRTTNDTMLVERAVSDVIGDLAREPFVLLAAIVALVVQDVRLAALSLFLFPICVIPVAVFGRRVRYFAREGQAKLADLTSLQQETLFGASIVKAFGMEDFEKRRFFNHSQSVFRRAVKIVQAKAAVMPIIEFISVIAGCLVLLYARWANMTWDQLVMFLGALVVMYDPVKKLSRLHLGIQHSSAAAERIFEILDTEITVRDRVGARRLEPPVREIRFEGVGFSYDTEPVLTDINLTVTGGECIALVGGSGGGKTTLVNLLPRFFDVTAGVVRINGVDIRDYTLKSLRQSVGLVTQETILFNETVSGNIAYGHPNPPMDRIEEAARLAYAHEFILEMPEGYRTVIGERGVRLSGGQRQRLAIARAIFRNPPILILDEATSSLDTESERQVQAALDNLMQGRTVFAIAHRLSTITHADRILVLSEGRIVEEGTHDALLARGGMYKYLYDLQFAVA